MSRSLNEVEWKEFLLENLFEIQNVYGKPIENYNKGNFPYISTSSLNNGMIDFVALDGNVLSKKNAISVDPIKGKCFFHKYEFIGRGYSGASINLLYNKRITKNMALFLCIAIENTAKNKASYGYLFNSDRLRKAKILLPITSKGEPDYDFMEEYIKEKEEKLKQEYKSYIQERIAKLQKKVDIKNKEWKPFLISNIFDEIQRGKRLTKEKQIKGNIPYISSTAMNNGVDNFIGNKNSVRKFKNCLSIANSGSVGACFYEPFEYIASDHVTRLNGSYTKYAYLFLANQLSCLSKKYNFNREIKDTRISKEHILLPINSKNEPDYEFMHNYMLYLEQKKILEYLDYIK